MDIVVSRDNDGVRADRLVRNSFENVGYVFLQKLFRQGNVKVNGKKVKADCRVHTDDVVSVFAKGLFEVRNDNTQNPDHDHRLKKMFDEMLIFENEDLVALNKISGLAVQLGSKLNFCLENILKSSMEKYFLVHRLDKDTSGILLVAKNQSSARKLTQLFREGKIKKTYWAIADGKISEAGVIKNFIGKSFVSGEEHMTVTDEKNGQEAITKYKPLKRVGYFTLLELKPSTGRKHQLRVHCSESLKAPILGDAKYNLNSQHKNLFLHAKHLDIPELNISLDVKLPKYFQDMIESESK